MIQNDGKPFVLWASARTASSAFFYEYADRNNGKVQYMKHEPLNVQKTLQEGGILEIISQKYSFKCMVNTSLVMDYWIEKKFHSDYTPRAEIMRKELDNIQQAIPIMDYTHIILYRRDLYARQRSFMFSKYNDVWSKEDIKNAKDFSWHQFDKEYIPELIDEAIKWEIEVLDMYVERINILKEHDISYQIVEFNDAIQYIGKDTSQGTKQYYDEMFQSEELKKSLENLITNHKFYSMI